MKIERDRVTPPGQRGSCALVALLVAVSVVVMGTSCVRRSGGDPDVLVIEETEQTASFIRNFNPLSEAGDVRWTARRAMYEPMQIFEPLRGDYVPWLAERYQWLDGARRLRFTTRSNVRWSDGTPFSAHDVAFTFDLLKQFPALDTRGLWGFV